MRRLADWIYDTAELCWCHWFHRSWWEERHRAFICEGVAIVQFCFKCYKDRLEIIPGGE